MTRKAVFDAARAAGADFNKPGAVAILENALDQIGIPREGVATLRQLKAPEMFYKGLRALTGPLDQTQVDVVQALLSAASSHKLSWLAYELATGWHEARLKPIEEYGKGKGRPYGVPGKYGQAQYGRGLVQLTWDSNYEKADTELGLGGALLKDFSLALRPDIAVKIMVHGMEEGWFSGRKLADFLPDERATAAQFTEARRIINGTDRADLICGYALQIQAALSAGGWA